MRIPSSHDRRNVRDSMSMTPMIDVVFLLLIFFVCAAVGQVRESILPTELSAGSLSSPEKIERDKPLGEVWLHLRQRADRTLVEVNGRDYDDYRSLKETLRSLAELAPEIPVILDIEADVPVGDMIRVYDICRAAEFQSINFATDAGETASGSRKRI